MSSLEQSSESSSPPQEQPAVQQYVSAAERINPKYNPAHNELGAAVLSGLLHTEVTWDQPTSWIVSNNEVTYTADIGSGIPPERRTRIVIYPDTRRASIGKAVHGMRKLW